jgi:hypothetical protein
MRAAAARPPGRHLSLPVLLAGPVPLRHRIGQVLAGTAAVVAAAGWWVLIVTLWPASGRPYVGGSTNDSILELVFGYNGLGRIFGGSGNGGAAGGASGSSFGGATGLSGLFSSEMGNEISWLLLSARDAVEDRIAGLDAGAQDYVTKPFSLAEVVTRVRGMLRRAGIAAETAETRLVTGHEPSRADRIHRAPAAPARLTGRSYPFSTIRPRVRSRRRGPGRPGAAGGTGSPGSYG